MASDDRDRAELEYLTTRLSELRAELRRSEAELGAPINEDTARTIVAEATTVLRGAGKAELAARYQAAVERATCAIAYQARLIEEGADDVSVRDAREHQDDAIEELQRVDAEVDAFFEKR